MQIRKIRKDGLSPTVAIPTEYMEAMQVEIGDYVILRLEKDTMKVKKLKIEEEK